MKGVRRVAESVVSVVIRAFNCERYVGQAVESILAQTFQDLEIVVVDDASTDGTETILQAYARRDERIRVLRNETNQGLVRTMNIGLRHARGEFIAVNDADDLSLPHRLETQVNFLRANPQIALVGGGAYYIDEDGEEIESPSRERRQRKGPEEVRQYLAEGYSFAHSSVMFRRECIEAIDFYDEFFSYTHDYDMLIRMADTFDIVYYEEPLVQWRWLNSGVTGGKKRAQAAFAELARVRSKARKERVSLDLEQEYNRLLASEAITNGRYRNRPISDATYYYSIGRLLLKKGKPQQARKRFLRALKHRGSIIILLRVLVSYFLSFFPGVFDSRPVQALQKGI
jgi:glycosyltransferase involved in cell wall biosynthesis